MREEKGLTLGSHRAFREASAHRELLLSRDALNTHHICSDLLLEKAIIARGLNACSKPADARASAGIIRSLCPELKLLHQHRIRRT